MQTRRLSPPRDSYREAVLALAPTGYWQLAEPSGTVGHDEMRGTTGTYVNTPTFGVVGPLVGDSTTATTFTRASSECMTTGVNVQTVVDNWTILAWVNLPSLNAVPKNVLYNGNNSNGYGLFIDATNKAQGYSESVGDLFTPSGGPTLVTATWNLIGLVRRAGTTYLTVNGAAFLTGTTSTPSAVSGQTAVGAENGSAHFFDGSIFGPAIFSRPLPFTDIYRLYRIGRGIS